VLGLFDQRALPRHDLFHALQQLGLPRLIE